jgi:hypothetical protein
MPLLFWLRVRQVVIWVLFSLIKVIMIVLLVRAQVAGTGPYVFNHPFLIHYIDYPRACSPNSSGDVLRYARMFEEDDTAICINLESKTDSGH